MDASIHNRHFCFRFSNLLWLLFSGLAVNLCGSEPGPKKDPEAVYVVVEKARLYAGPSSDFYPTGEAKHGATLEVYQRTNNGWLGVRPPQGSFSWIPASQAYMLPGGRVIEITDASAVSWIGTELGSAKQYRWQIQLNVGEQLSVLGEATINNGEDDREALWYRVAPPAGEFRWIEQAAVSTTAPATKPLTEATDSIVESASAEAHSDRKTKSEAAVRTASSEGAPKQAAAPEDEEIRGSQPGPSVSSSHSKSAERPPQSKANQSGAKAQSSQRSGNEWDGWHAFEMSDKGVRTPFLDKLSGRDRGQATRSPKPPLAHRDPLIQDPFSLAMEGEPIKPSSEEVNSLVRQQREWRDPKILRDARLANSSLGSFGASGARSVNASSLPIDPQMVQSARAADLQTGLAPNREVGTAGYAHELPQPDGSGVANVNWFGLAADSSNLMAPSNSQNFAPNRVITSTADVAELQLTLNNTVAASNGPWNLTLLADRARYLIEHGPSAVDRGQARLLLERIEAFQNVSARSQQFSGSTPVQSTGYLSPASTLPMNGASTAFSTPRATYDATGWLVPVHAGGPDQPTHALTSDTGDIVAYVSPIAGLNLDRYRNQAVGISGLRGYLPQLQAAHIQAQRISRIR